MNNPLKGATAGIVKILQAVGRGRGWFPIIKESFAGAWQQNVEVVKDSVVAFAPNFACMTLIASDISKLPLNLIGLTDSGVWQIVDNPAYSKVLRKPNNFQNRIQFIESWVLSKMQAGNTYVLKVRDARGVVSQLKVLDPNLVEPLVSDAGEVFYQLAADNVVGIEAQVTVPASEIIHDRFNTLFHPLCGLPPIYAAGVIAMQGIYIQENSAKLFKNGSQAPGILTAPGAIGDDTAKRLKDHWEANYVGQSNYGKVAVLGDGLKYERAALSSGEAQLIEQLNWGAVMICAVYHVPPYKIGVGEAPPYTNIQSVNLQYYQDCIQNLVEAIELCLDEGLGLANNVGVQFDVEALLRMDSLTQTDVITKRTGAGLMKIDEGRAVFGMAPIAGGNAAYLQQQNYSLEALSKRDSKDDPFAKTGDKTTTQDATTPAVAEDDNSDDAIKLLLMRAKSLTEE